MFNKKQARYSVSIPYELRENKLWIQPINWPQQCPCSNEKDVSVIGTYPYTHKARYSQSSTGTQTLSFSYPLDWDVPYCLRCLEHVKRAENWKYGIAAVVIFVPIILALMINASSDILILLLYAGFIIGGLALYKIKLEAVIKRSLSPTCLDHNYAIWAPSPPTDENKITFNFEGDEYANLFANSNMAQLEI